MSGTAAARPMAELGLTREQEIAILGYMLKTFDAELSRMLDRQSNRLEIGAFLDSMMPGKFSSEEVYNTIKHVLEADYAALDRIEQRCADRADAVWALVGNFTGMQLNEARERLKSLQAGPIPWGPGFTLYRVRSSSYPVDVRLEAVSPGDAIGKVSDSLHAQPDRSPDDLAWLDKIAKRQADEQGPAVMRFLTLGAKAEEILSPEEKDAIERQSPMYRHGSPDERHWIANRYLLGRFVAVQEDVERERLNGLKPGLGDEIMGWGEKQDADRAPQVEAWDEEERRKGERRGASDLFDKVEVFHPSQEVSPSGVVNPQGKMTQAQIGDAKREGKL